jgi:DNA repair protein RecN (Recombination protein N)
MLSFLRIQNVALIRSLEAEFGPGLNLLTGETGSGKSIIVDSLGALTGERVSSDLIKEGEETATIEGLFTLSASPDLHDILDESGIEIEDSTGIDLIVRREISLTGKNRIFINNQLVTASLLKRIGPFLVDIHGQGEQTALFDPRSHLEMLDEFAATETLREKVSDAFQELKSVRSELVELHRDEAEKLQLVDILKFQVDELKRASLKPGESEDLDEEKRRLNNVEKLSTLGEEAYSLLYEMDNASLATVDQAIRKIEELGEFDSRFRELIDGLQTARAVLEDASITVRDFRSHLEFSPERLEEIESRLASIASVTRKYGGTVETALDHLAESETRLSNIESAELRVKELTLELNAKKATYVAAAQILSDRRIAAARKFEKAVESDLKTVALEKAKFNVMIDANPDDENRFTANGFDRVEFYFSANPGESPKPLAKVVSGGESSRLTLILKTASHMHITGKTAVFDEIDAGIGGRVAEAVGERLKQLAQKQQVMCVTHQAQVASKADRHFVVEKAIEKRTTTVTIRALTEPERIEEIARMLAGETITEAARENAREMLAAAG